MLLSQKVSIELLNVYVMEYYEFIASLIQLWIYVCINGGEMYLNLRRYVLLIISLSRNGASFLFFILCIIVFIFIFIFVCV